MQLSPRGTVWHLEHVEPGNDEHVIPLTEGDFRKDQQEPRFEASSAADKESRALLAVPRYSEA